MEEKDTVVGSPRRHRWKGIGSLLLGFLLILATPLLGHDPRLEQAKAAVGKGHYLAAARLWLSMSFERPHRRNGVASWLRPGDELKMARDAYSEGNFVTAAKLMHSLAQKGDPEVQYNLGQMYETGRGLRQDYVAAITLYQRAEKNGVAEAMQALGLVHYFGLGVPQDFASALGYFHAAAEKKGLARSKYYLGVMYFDGQGVPPSAVRAMEWFRKAAELGHAEAQVELGAGYANGNGVPRDLIQAHMWFDLAERGGIIRAAALRDALQSQMSREEMATARRMSLAWRPAPPAGRSADWNDREAKVVLSSG